MTPLGRPVEPDVNRILAIVSPFTRVARRVDRRRGGVACEHRRTAWRAAAPAPTPTPRARRRPAARPRSARSNGAPSAANTRPGCMRSKTCAQRAELAGLQRVGRRDRRVGHADVHRGQRQQRVLDAVAGEDHERCDRGDSPRSSSACARRRTCASASRVGHGAPARHRVGRLPGGGVGAAPGTRGRAPRPPSARADR